MVLRDIGEGDAAALLCTTDEMACCTGNNRAGEWYYPDGGVVPIMTPTTGSPEPYYRNRGSSLIRLNRRPNQGLSLMYTGMYCCRIPYQGGVMQTLCVGAYLTESAGESYACAAIPIILYGSYSLSTWNNIQKRYSEVPVR